MRYLVISDIHANLEAFETVMAAAKPLGYEKVLLLGDLVGYGADPNAICERVRDLKPDALDPRQPRQGRLRRREPRGLQRRRAQRDPVDLRHADTRKTATGSRRCRPGPLIVDDTDRDLPRHAVRRRRLRLRRSRRAARHACGAAAALPVRPHARAGRPLPVARSVRPRDRRRSAAAGAFRSTMRIGIW